MLDRHSEDTLTLHAELMALLLAREGERKWSHLAGTFTTKPVAGLEYVYFQYSDAGGKKRQLSIGRSTPAIDAIIETYRASRDQSAEELERIARLARLLRAAGLAMLPHPAARVIRGLADAGVFRLGGLLVGSYAFVVIGNSLGVKWPPGAWRTQDVDLASKLEVGTPLLDADVPTALESLKMGFVPVPQLDPRHASTSFKVRGQQLRVDLITPGSDRQQDPVYIPRLKAAAAPIKFLSLLMEESQPTAAVDGGATLVAVPAPARYALHKLLVSQSRSLTQQTKSGKDLHQAALLLEVLAEDRPDDVDHACARFAAAGEPVTRKLLRALLAIEKRWPDARQGVALTRKLLHG